MDTLTPARRSEIMGRVKSKDTRPELAVRRLLHGMGYRFRLHRASLPGNPDIVLPRFKAAIFVHGCFWHRHTGCLRARMPQSNSDYWRFKFERNIQRDRLAQRALRKSGWRVLVIWECQIGKPALIRRLEAFLYPFKGDA